MTEELVVDLNLRIREELLSLSALNPWVRHSSSPRGLMMCSHLAQIVVIENGEAQIIQTGLERQLAESTFSKKLEYTSRLVGIINRYRGVSATSARGLAEQFILIEDLDNNRLDVMTLPRFHKLHQSFGFRYNINHDVVNPNSIDNVYKAGTILADSPTVAEDGSYKFGIPVNLAYLHIPEVTGDGVVISEELAQRFKYRTYETIVVEFGEKSFPLNLYGDADNYKPFPDIGEVINSDRVVIATREYESELVPALLSRTDVNEYSPYFDKPFYAKATDGKVIDIKVYHNPKARVSTYTKTTEQVDKYARALKQYYEDIIKLYEARNQEHRAQFGVDMAVSEHLHRLLLDAYSISETKRNIRFTHKNDLVDLYRIEFTIEYETSLDVGSKVTTLHGVDRNS